MTSEQSLPVRGRVDLGDVAMKGYSTFPKAPGLQRQFSVILWTLVRWSASSLQGYSRSIASSVKELRWFQSPRRRGLEYAKYITCKKVILHPKCGSTGYDTKIHWVGRFYF